MQEPAAPTPVEFSFQFFCARDEIRQIEPKQVVSFDHIRIALLDQSRQTFDRGVLGFWKFLWINNNQLFPVAVVRQRDAHDVICIAL